MSRSCSFGGQMLEQIPAVATVFICVWVGAAFHKESTMLLSSVILALVAPSPLDALVVWAFVSPGLLAGAKFASGWFDK